MLWKLLVSAVFAGYAAGLLAAALQQLFVIPVLLEAELYESGELVHFGGSQSGTALTHDHDSHDHGGEDGGDRVLWTWFMTSITYVGFALVLTAAIAMAERFGQKILIRTGLIWGAAGFAAVHLFPAMGHPPELPGSAAADLAARQVWWAMTALFSAFGIACIAMGRSWPLWIAGIFALIVPHLIGAPHPAQLAGTVPPEIAALFVGRSLGVALIAWVSLGGFVAYFWTRENGLWAKQG